MKPEYDKFNAEITRHGLLDMQLCVPVGWTDEQVKHYADRFNPSGTAVGWTIRREGNPLLEGDPERQPCQSMHNRVHIILDA